MSLPVEQHDDGTSFVVVEAGDEHPDQHGTVHGKRLEIVEAEVVQGKDVVAGATSRSRPPEPHRPVINAARPAVLLRADRG